MPPTNRSTIATITITVVAVAVALVGVVGFRACTPAPTAPDAAAGSAPATNGTADGTAGAGSTTVSSDVAQGWSRDGAGARAAAIAAVGATGEIARAGFITRTDMIEALATTRYGPVLAADSAAQLAAMTGELGAAGVPASAVLFAELALTARVVTVDDVSARVEVWAVTVFAVTDAGAPRQVWRTVTVDLAWEGGTWRVDGWSARPGPTPALAVNVAVAEVDEVAVVVSWPPVGAR